MVKGEAIKRLEWYFEEDNGISADLVTKQAFNTIKKALSQEPTSEMVHVETLRQVMWERDIAIGQLKELGYSFGQKIEPCEDCISRQYLLDNCVVDKVTMPYVSVNKIKEAPPVKPQEPKTIQEKQAESEKYQKAFDDGYANGYMQARFDYEQEPKTGHWIKYGIPRCGEQHYKCTLCEYYINFGQWGELYTKEFKYCPNCGARMRGAENENR